MISAFKITGNHSKLQVPEIDFLCNTFLAAVSSVCKLKNKKIETFTYITQLDRN